MTKTKVVDLKKLYNFVVDNFFIWNHLSMKKSREFAHIWNSNFSNDLGWRNNQNKSCSAQKIMQLYSWRLFHLKSSIKKKSREFPHIWNSNFSNDLGWRNDQNKICRSRKVIKLCSWQLFLFNLLWSQILILKQDEHLLKHLKYSNYIIVYF